MRNFKTVDDHPDMGLDNTLCTDKKYYCKSHRIFLSEKDAHNKGCFEKWDSSMIEKNQCNFLIDKEALDEEKERYSFRDRKKGRHW